MTVWAAGRKPRDAQFSDDAHSAMVAQVYPEWFPFGVEVGDLTCEAADLDYAIDRVLRVTMPGRNFRKPMIVHVQERFRRMPTVHNDITITEWNDPTGTPSELYKLGAQLFVYGICEERPRGAEPRAIVHEAWAYSIPRIQRAFLRDRLPHTYVPNQHRGQPFIGLRHDHLQAIGALEYHYNRREPHRG